MENTDRRKQYSGIFDAVTSEITSMDAPKNKYKELKIK